MSGEFRSAVGQFVDELLSTMHCPFFPVCSILLEEFVDRFLGEVPNVAIAATAGKKDNSFALFCLETVTTVAVRVCPQLCHSEKQPANASIAFSSSIKEIFRPIITNIAGFWSRRLMESNSNSDVIEKAPPAAKKQKGKGKVKAAKVESITEEMTERPLSRATSTQIAADVITALLNVASSSDHDSDGLDLIAELQQFLTNPHLLVTASEIEIMLERPLALVENENQIFYQVTECLFSSLDTTSIFPRGGYSDSSGTHYFMDAYFVLLTQWMQSTEKISVSDAVDSMQSLITSLSPLNFPLDTEVHFPTALDSELRRTYLSTECVVSRYKQLLGLTTMRLIFDAVMAAVLNMLRSSSPIIRSRAMKNLAKIIHVDSNLVSNDMVRTAVLDRLNDVAISVREEVVKLVGAYLKLPSAPESYLDGILVRLRDKGVSVRKAVVNIIRELLLYHPDHPRYAELCLALLERRSFPKEEDSIRDSVQSTFQTLWFTPLSSAVLSSLSSTSMSNSVHDEKYAVLAETAGAKFDELIPAKEVPDEAEYRPSKALMASSNPEQDHLQASCVQMLDVVDYLENATWMVNLVREMLHGRGNGNETNKALLHRRAESEAHCLKVVDCLVEMLLKAEENDDALVKQIRGKRTLPDHIDLIIHTLALFSEVKF
jgi:hypothetical protein